MWLRACLDVLEVISWWPALGLLVLPWISSELATWVHQVEITVEEQLRAFRWVGVAACLGLGKWVLVLLWLACGSSEQVWLGRRFPVG